MINLINLNAYGNPLNLYSRVNDNPPSLPPKKNQNKSTHYPKIPKPKNLDSKTTFFKILL